MIYIEFCTQRSILNFLGVSYFLRTIPSKSGLLAGQTSNAHEGGDSTRSVRWIVNKAHALLQFCTWDTIPAKESAPHSNTRDTQPKIQKNAVFSRFGTVFNQTAGASRISRWGTHSLADRPVQTQKRKKIGVIFENSSDRVLIYNWITNQMDIGTSLGRRHN